MTANRACGIGLLLVSALLGVSARHRLFNSVSTVKMARCSANCMTEVSKNSKPDPGCHGDECKKCMAPCKSRFITIQKCKSSCKRSKICEASCEFLFNSIADPKKNTITEQPGPPVAVAMTFTNLTLSWKPAKSSQGSVVYLLKERYTGDFKSRFPIEHPLVFLEARAVISVKQLCRSTPRRRFSFNGFDFFFTVVALTEHGTMSPSKESSAIQMKKPDPVVQIAMPQFRYDPASIGDKVRLTTTVTPSPERAAIITGYAMTWSMKFCRPFVVPRSTLSASKTITMLIYQELKACNHSLTVYSMSECIPSLPNTLTYEYKGCRFIRNFNKTFCHSFDPPPTPNGARAVRNLRHSPLHIRDDFRVNTTILWLPPSYPFAPVSQYYYAFGDTTEFFMGNVWKAIRGATKNASLNLRNLFPNITVRVEVTPFFPKANGVKESITFRTPAIPEKQIQLSDLWADKFHVVASKLITVRVSWSPPHFTRGLVEYQIEYTKGREPKKTITTKNCFYVFSGIIYSEPLYIKVKSVYSFKWIQPKCVELRLRAPAPNVHDIIVQNLRMQKLKINNDQNTFAVTFAWQAPVFQKYKAVDYYQIYFYLVGKSCGHFSCPSYRVNPGRKCPPTRTKNNHYLIPSVCPNDFVVLSVKTIFKDSPYVEGFIETIMINPLKSFSCYGKAPGFYVDPGECRSYFRCDGHGGAYHLKCNDQLYWNPLTNSCDHRSKVDCKNDVWLVDRPYR